MKRQMQRLLGSDGRILVVAMDHTSFLPAPMGGLVNYADTVRDTSAAGADAYLSPLGSLTNHGEAFGTSAVICSIDPMEPFGRHAVAAAAAAGADAVKTMMYPFSKDMDTMVNQCAAVAAEAAKYGLPYLAEPIPGGFMADDSMRTPEIIAAGSRIAMEAGADFVKTYYPGTVEGMKMVVDYANVPVIVLGGEKKDTLHAVFQDVYEAVVQGGASGVAIGRNIWASDRPADIVKGLVALLHEDASVEQAVKAAGGEG